MKTVTIPTCANPFVVFVNGIKYTYPAGATVEVPDDVAAVIEQHDEAHSKPAPAPVVPPFEPSEGGGGLPVVEIATLPTEEGALLTEEEAAKMNALNGGLCVLKVNYVQDEVAYPVTAYPSIMDAGVMCTYICLVLNWYIILTKYEDNWSIAQMQVVT